MKHSLEGRLRFALGTILATALGTPGLLLGAEPAQETVPARTGDPARHHVVVVQKHPSDPLLAAATSSRGQDGERKIVIQRVERDGSPTGTSREQVPWLGVGTEEASEALAAQLGLKSGEGLVVTFVAENSPAAKAGVKQHDVLVDLDKQLLVHPAQLRKLVQSRSEGDTVKLTLIRASQRQTVEATLGKTEPRYGLLDDERGWHGDLSRLGPALRDEMRALGESLSKAGIDQKSLNIEIRRSAEEARRALEKALRQSTGSMRHLEANNKALADLARSGLHVTDDATVTVRSHQRDVRTAVKTDDTGTYVIVASPRKRLTAHDKTGTLLFDGEIETEAQQKLVPPEIWERVSPLLEELTNGEQPKAEDEPEPGKKEETLF